MEQLDNADIPSQTFVARIRDLLRLASELITVPGEMIQESKFNGSSLEQPQQSNFRATNGLERPLLVSQYQAIHPREPRCIRYTKDQQTPEFHAMTIKYFYTDGGVHPVAGHVLYRQAQAQDGRDTGRFNRYLCGVLEAVAQRPEDCDRLLSLIGQVERGEQEKLETGGNDVALTLEDGRVQVDILVNEDWIGQAAGNFAFAEWKTALVAWRQFLAMPKGLESAVEIGL